MRRAPLPLLAALGLLLGAGAANAGPITSTIGGLPSVTIGPAGTSLTIDTVITFGPTLVGGAAVPSGLEISFDATSIVAGGGAGPLGGSSTSPPGWIDVTGGIFTCDLAGFCENVVVSGMLFSGPPFPAGSTFALPSIVIDTTGAAAGSYSVGASFSPAGPDHIFAAGVDVTPEYSIVVATINILPEPGTASLLALGLGLLGAGRRRRRGG